MEEKDAEIAELKTRVAMLEETVKALAKDKALAKEGQTAPVGRQQFSDGPDKQ